MGLPFHRAAGLRWMHDSQFGCVRKCENYMRTETDEELEEVILRKMSAFARRRGVLRPDSFDPPIPEGELWRVGCRLFRKGLTTCPAREQGGWRLRLL